MWMKYNKLKINIDKIDFIIFSTRKSAGTFFWQQLTFGDTTVEAGSKVRNPGVTSDQNMSNQRQVNTTAKILLLLFEMYRTHPQAIFLYLINLPYGSAKNFMIQ